MNDVLEFWFPNDKFNKFWFDKSKDKFIIENFKNKLIDLENTFTFEIVLSDKEILENIILLDQFSRSIYRNNLDKIKDNDRKALYLSNYFFKSRDWVNIKFNYLIFYLMPLRHTFQKKYYDFIFQVLNKITINNEDKPLFDKFYKTTKIKYQQLND